MIKITGTTHQTFHFPADLSAATTYYSDFTRILHYLPHIQLITTYNPGQFRVMYHTLELNVYRVRIYCDMQIYYEEATRTLHVTPLAGKPPVKSAATVHALTAQGYFASQSIFHERGDHSLVDYRLSLEARLPRPFGLALMPERVIEQIARNITDWRIHEIAGGFVKRSIQEYRQPAAWPVSRSGLACSARPEWCPVVAAPRIRPPR